MTISIIENSHMPFVRDFSTGNEQLSKKALRAQRQRELKNGEAHNHQAGEITEDTRRKLRDVVGTENLVASLDVTRTPVFPRSFATAARSDR
jgi:hypothetical protein